MKITKDEILYVANLAKIELKKEEEEKISSQIENILEYIKKIDALDTSDVEPTYNTPIGSNFFREDIIKEHLGSETSLFNAPEKDDGYFIVPKIIK